MAGSLIRTFLQKAHWQAKVDEIFEHGNFVPGYEREFQEGYTHGFAVRGKLSDRKVKAGQEDSVSKSVKFFKKHLRGNYYVDV
ncbi:hypothetical protein BJ138DRAFT_1157690 [Hygrophoropsis aurantiaca]|uniref:Uncharacterized protein n=1 Tax=Hygrophoropsis aurantiaca TaxID=72124 RepID=A0ACB8A5Y3_9AGAM|nr:hypothetical protein BJ138DRAFT_1157690 [Hygrophoropsis aurantiaca]